jgi:hypothetical protein
MIATVKRSTPLEQVLGIVFAPVESLLRGPVALARPITAL